MPLINLSHLEMILNAINVKYAEVSDAQFLSWLSNEDIVKPVTTADGAFYTTNNDEIYIL